jgi:uncharacterized membrane protein YhaH (DUF805 family)
MATQADDFTRSLFHAQGRSSRERYWLTVLLLLLSMLIAGFFAHVMESIGAVILGVIVVLPIMLAAFAIGIFNAVKRMHDMGRSGWWLAPIFLVLVVFALPSELARYSDDADFAAAAGALSRICNLIYLIAMGAIPGTHGSNKYGDQPSRPVREVADENPGETEDF